MLQCQIPWSELYCLQYGINPNDVGRAMGREDLFPTKWVYDPRLQCFHINYRHGCSGNPLVIFNITPIEAERQLHSSGRNGVLSDGQQRMIRNISPIVRQLAGVRPGAQAAQMQQQMAQQQQMARQQMPQQMPGYPPGYYPPQGRR
jgi:hypothetical protein